jgi:hypothetical protein
MNVAYKGPWPEVSEADALLMDVARRIQLTKTKHDVADRNFRALCQYVDREGSPLQGSLLSAIRAGVLPPGLQSSRTLRRLNTTLTSSSSSASRRPSSRRRYLIRYSLLSTASQAAGITAR